MWQKMSCGIKYIKYYTFVFVNLKLKNMNNIINSIISDLV